MPRQVDHDERRLQIARAALAVIAERGLAGLSIRAVADRLGGSTTLVTHYVPSRERLIAVMLAALEQRWDRELAELEAHHPGGRDRLRALMHWGLPADELGLLEARARLALHGDPRDRARARPTLETFDRAWSRRLHDTVADLEPDPRRRAALVELLDTVVHGVTVQAGEGPDAWPPRRQLAVVDNLLAELGLAPD